MGFHWWCDGTWWWVHRKWGAKHSIIKLNKEKTMSGKQLLEWCTQANVKNWEGNTSKHHGQSMILLVSSPAYTAKCWTTLPNYFGPRYYQGHENNTYVVEGMFEWWNSPCHDMDIGPAQKLVILWRWSQVGSGLSLFATEWLLMRGWDKSSNSTSIFNMIFLAQWMTQVFHEVWVKWLWFYIKLFKWVCHGRELFENHPGISFWSDLNKALTKATYEPADKKQIVTSIKHLDLDKKKIFLRSWRNTKYCSKEEWACGQWTWDNILINLK